MADLSALSSAERNEAMRRYRIIEPHLESGCSLEDIASASSVTCRTLQRWVGHYRKHGLSGLVRKSRSDHGGRRVVSEHIQKII
jgi:putative transposase